MKCDGRVHPAQCLIAPEFRVDGLRRVWVATCSRVRGGCGAVVELGDARAEREAFNAALTDYAEELAASRRLADR